MKLKLLLSLIFLACCFTGKAQFVDLGQDPASIKWKQINTDDFQIIYPDFFEKNAQKIANIYAALYHSSNSLSLKPKKISMIIHATGGISNGSAGWAPKKSDLYSTPPQEPGESWLEHLCTHEFRHVVQYDKINQGFTNVLYHIFGEQIVMAVLGLFTPMWFVEGDAVSFETAVGHIGRGRSPEFINEMKALVLEKKIYSYDKAVLGSYRSFIPDRYTLGYFMVANAKKNYGPEIWENALSRIGRKTFTFTPFTTAIKRTLEAKRDSLWNSSHFLSTTIKKDSIKKANKFRDAKKTLYYDNFTELKENWLSQSIQEEPLYDTVSTQNDYFTGYYYPTSTADGRLIAYKKGFEQSGAFVFIDREHEEMITRTGQIYDQKFATRDHILVWSEYDPHLRWEHGGKLVLVGYNIKNKKYSYHRSPYNRFSPFSLNNQWGCVEVDNENNSFIVILDSTFKNELLRIKAGEDELFIHPSYNGEHIITVVQGNEGNHIETIHPATLERKKITESLRYEIDNPVADKDNLYFRASFDNNNALYRQNLQSGETTHILGTPFGVRFPTLNPTQNTLHFSFYTADGYKPGKIDISNRNGKPVSMQKYALADALKPYDNIRITRENESVYESRKYRKILNLFNIHSWGPMYVNQYDSEIDAGLIVYSQNKLSTLSLAAGYIYTNAYPKGAWMLNATYKGIWPVFSLDIKTDIPQKREIIELREIPIIGWDSIYVAYKQRYTTGDLTMSLPFDISRKNYYRSITPYVRYKIEAVHHSNEKAISLTWPETRYKARIPSNYYQMLEYGIQFVNQTYRTEQDLNPRWGQTIQAGYRNTPWKKIDLGEEWWASGYFYFPGFYNKHSITIYGGYQKRSNNLLYGLNILTPRGMLAYYSDFFTVRNSYQFPLLYPDLPIGPVAYIKAINGGFFLDLMGQELDGSFRDVSYGWELTADCHFLRLPFPVNIGIRAGYETQTNRMFTDFLFNVNFYF